MSQPFGGNRKGWAQGGDAGCRDKATWRGGAEQLHELERGEALEFQAHGGLRDLIAYAVGAAQEQELHEVEREVFARVLALGRTMVKRVLAEKGTGKSGATVTLVDGREVPFHAVRTRHYFSIFGKLEIDRAYHWAPGLASCMPLDASRNLPERCYSYLLREWVEHLGVEHAFEKAVDTLGMILRVKVPKRVVGLLAREAEPDVQGFYEQKGALAPESEGEILVGAVDGKGVPMRRAEPRAKKLRLGSGEKPNKKRRNRAYMQYDAFLELGDPIGTGVVEGACRNLVRDRMELVGMHWTKEGAEAILAFRAVKLNDDWEAFWEHRVAQERARRYEHRERVDLAEAA